MVDVPSATDWGGALVPVTLTTLSAAEGQSLRQCVDPGHFDFSTGNFAFSYCWRYACLSPTFASSDFTATVTDLDRFNVKNMEAGAQYNATIKATAGVVVRVTAQPKEAGASALMFNNTGASSNAGGSFSGNVTSPPSGISSFTLVITVPVGFDDLSTTVAMELYPGQYLPPAPPAPPGSLCRCPNEPDVLGACSEGETLALVTRPGSNVTMAQCLYLPSYDVFQQQLVFSTCWRWACFSLAFRGPTSPDTIKSYTITLTNVTKTYNLDKEVLGADSSGQWAPVTAVQMPGGLFRLQVLKPTAVNMSVSVYGPGPSPSTFGPWSSTAEVVLPPSTSAMDIVIDVPNLDFVDGSRGAIIFQPTEVVPGLNREVVPHDDAKFFSNWGPWHKVDKEDLASLQALVPPLPGVFEWGAQPPGAAADNLSILAFYLGKAGIELAVGMTNMR
ncbi:uncharacterized protein HaLaN_03861 [Haematococcus lacustris]|uniref:Uncharacterized protein n=1 Tax=Haematococcus lacustris TaxID=44745 RepID=A0A699YF99_HAELA|nr:uncharacterized protein HaLaN_03861 [Haematococcus lacustris]